MVLILLFLFANFNGICITESQEKKIPRGFVRQRREYLNILSRAQNCKNLTIIPPYCTLTTYEAGSTELKCDEHSHYLEDYSKLFPETEDHTEDSTIIV